jgi:hypothetical protein
MRKNNLVLYFSFVAILSSVCTINTFAQQDIIYKKDSTQIRCKILSGTPKKFKYAYLDSLFRVFKTTILNTDVDSVHYNFYETDLIQHKLFNKNYRAAPGQITSLLQSWKNNFGIGLNAGNIIEFNHPSGNNKKSLSGTFSLDAVSRYSKEGSRFSMANEFHWLFSLQKSALTSTAHIQRIADDISTLHDFSIAIGKSKKWGFNLIARLNTSVFNIYNGDYFKDINNLGKIQGFLSPYDITISPGIKWQPDKNLQVSISPYSFNLYGVKSQQVSNTGIFITDTDLYGNYKKNLFKRLGAEINFWYDKQIKSWLNMQYRLGISSNYFEKIARNGLMNGLFITKLKIAKNMHLTHRAVLKADLAMKPFKPYYSQTILLSYAKSF